MITASIKGGIFTYKLRGPNGESRLQIPKRMIKQVIPYLQKIIKKAAH